MAQDLALSSFFLVADGACSGNPGPGGYGLIVTTPQGQVFERGGYDAETTNNRMELLGLIEGLILILEQLRLPGVSPAPIYLILDSSYVLDGAQKYIWNWSRNGWKTQTGDAVKNQTQWEQIYALILSAKRAGCTIHYHWVRGHSGDPLNERVDQIAVSYSKRDSVQLFQGTLRDYERINGFQICLPAIEVGKSASGERAGPKKIEYLAYVDGKLHRVKTWPECEALVKGRAGVRFKKVSSAQEAALVLKSWGL
jgi:ribonuclease HI